MIHRFMRFIFLMVVVGFSSKPSLTQEHYVKMTDTVFHVGDLIEHEFYHKERRFFCPQEPIEKGGDEQNWRYLDCISFIPIVKFIQAHPNFIFEIASHTDWRGSAKFLLDWSQMRAQAMVDCMIRTHNIDSSRVKAVGYGRSHPRTIYTCNGHYWAFHDDSLSQLCAGVPIVLTNEYIQQFKEDKVMFEHLHRFNRRIDVRIIGIKE
jgi:hypothetical protein